MNRKLSSPLLSSLLQSEVFALPPILAR